MENQSESTKKLLNIVREHLDNEAAENNLSEDTITKHGYQYSNLERFLLSIDEENILVNQVKVRHMEAFKNWIFKYTVTKSHGHVARHLRMCREALHYAVRMEWLENNCLTSMKLKRDKEKEVLSCDVFELRKFERFETNKKLWGIIVDLFLFQCYTGLSFMDLWMFELVDDDIILPSGERINITWVTCKTGRGKTQKRYWAEFIPEAKVIYERYENGFPKVWLQSYNRIIKKIAKDLGIKNWWLITTHIGRKTFATFMRNKGYSIPAIADMLGNTEEVARRNYIEQNKELIVSEIIRVNQWNQYKPNIAS